MAKMRGRPMAGHERARGGFTGRRQVLAGLATGTLAAAISPALGQDVPAVPGLVPNADGDQSDALQRAIQAALASGTPLALPAGTYFVQNIALPAGLALTGVPGATILAGAADAPVATIAGQANVTLDGIGFSQGKSNLTGDRRGLLEIQGSTGVSLSRCAFEGGGANSLAVNDADVSITGCSFAGAALAAVFSTNSRGLKVTDNRIGDCGNGGVLVWRDQGGPDGSIVARNHIGAIRADAGGNGQNGNGINVFRADGVIVVDNVIADCAFSAVRVNSGDDTQIRGNSCANCGEVAIYSEFTFSGSLIADNTVDGAATGISITNFDQGGRLAVCSGNIVRNIASKSAVNPDVKPVGIAAEADTVISGNVVDSVPGIGISVGYGPYLRGVLVEGNIVRSADIGIAVSVAEGAGSARIAGNMIADSLQPMAGMAWDDVISEDLIADARRYPQLAIAGNTVS